MFPWLAAIALAFESNHVIAMRLAKFASGEPGIHAEFNRMVSEKISEATAAGVTLMTGGTSAKIVGQYRKRVAANARRLRRK